MKKSTNNDREQTSFQSTPTPSPGVLSQIDQYLGHIKRNWLAVIQRQDSMPSSTERQQFMLALGLLFTSCLKGVEEQLVGKTGRCLVATEGLIGTEGLSDLHQNLQQLLQEKPLNEQNYFKQLLITDNILFGKLCFVAVHLVDAKDQTGFNTLLKLIPLEFLGRTFKANPEVNEEGYNFYLYTLANGTPGMLKSLQQLERSQGSKRQSLRTLTLEELEEPTMNPPLFWRMLHNTDQSDDEIISWCLDLLDKRSPAAKNQILRRLLMVDIPSKDQGHPLPLLAWFFMQPKGLQTWNRPSLLEYLLSQADVGFLTQAISQNSKRELSLIDLILISHRSRPDLLQFIPRSELKKLMEEKRKWPVGEGSMTLFQYAVVHRSTECIKYLIEPKGLVKNVNVTTNIPEAGEITALIVAADQGDLELVQALLCNRGANPNIQGKDSQNRDGLGFTALCVAVGSLIPPRDSTEPPSEEEQMQRVRIIQLLLQNKANPNQGDGWSREMLSAEDSYSPLRGLLEVYAKHDDPRVRPLYLALSTDPRVCLTILKLLVESGADPDPGTEYEELRPLDMVLKETSHSSWLALEIFVRNSKNPHGIRKYPDGRYKFSLAGMGFFHTLSILECLCEEGKFKVDEVAALGSKQTFRGYCENLDRVNDETIQYIWEQKEGSDGVIKSIESWTTRQVLLTARDILEGYGLLTPRQEQGIEVVTHDLPVVSPVAESALWATGADKEVVCEEKVGASGGEEDESRRVFSGGQQVSQAAAEASHKPPTILPTVEESSETVRGGRGSQGSGVNVTKPLDPQAVAAIERERVQQQEEEKIQRQQQAAVQKAAKKLAKALLKAEDPKGSGSSKGAIHKKSTKKPAGPKKKEEAQAGATNSGQADVKSLVQAGAAGPRHVVNCAPVLKSMNKPVASSGILAASSLEANPDPSLLESDEVSLVAYRKQVVGNSELAVGTRSREKKKAIPMSMSVGCSNVAEASDLAKFWIPPPPGSAQAINKSLRQESSYQIAVQNLERCLKFGQDYLEGQAEQEAASAAALPYIETTLKLAVFKHILELANFMYGLKRECYKGRYGLLINMGILDRIADVRHRLAHCGAIPEVWCIRAMVQQLTGLVIAASDKEDCMNDGSDTLADQFYTDFCKPLLQWYEKQGSSVDTRQGLANQRLRCLKAFFTLQGALPRDIDYDENTSLQKKLVVAGYGFLLIQIYPISALYRSSFSLSDRDDWLPWKSRRDQLAHNGPSNDEGLPLVFKDTKNFLENMAHRLGQPGLSESESLSFFGRWSLCPPASQNLAAATSLGFLGCGFAPEQEQAGAGGGLKPIGAECAEVWSIRTPSNFFAATVSQEVSSDLEGDGSHPDRERDLSFAIPQRLNCFRNQ